MRSGWGMALALSLAACQAGPAARVGAPKAGSSASPAAKASLAPAPAGASASPPLATAGGTASGGSSPAGPLGQGFAIPPQVNVAIPGGLLGEGFSSLLGAEAVQLLANDGGGLLANDGGGLLGNDGGGLLANDGGGIVAGGAGNYRLAQAPNPDPTVAFIYQLTATSDPQPSVQNLLKLYCIQAATLNVSLQKLRGLPASAWKDGEVKPLYADLVVPRERLYLNVIRSPGPRGTGPIYWIYEVGPKAKGERRPRPQMVLHLQSPTEGRVLWRPVTRAGNSEVAFVTQFNLSKRRVIAELNAFSDLKGPGQAIRRVRWVFQGEANGRTSLRAHAIIRGEGSPEAASFRKVLLRFSPTGEASFALRHGLLPALRHWVGPSGERLLGPQWMPLPEVPELPQSALPQEEELDGPLSVEGMPSFPDVGIPEPQEDPIEGLVAGWPSQDFPATGAAVRGDDWPTSP